MQARDLRLVGLAITLVGAACAEKENPVAGQSPPSAAPAGSTPATPVTQPPLPELGQRMPSGPGPARPFPTLWLQPGDLVTSTGQTPIRAWLDNQGAPVEPSVLTTVASVLELREYPSLKIVPVSLTTYNPPVLTTPADMPGKGSTTTAPRAREERAYVEVQPKSPLADSWYVLSLSSIPSGVRPAPWSAQSPPAGAYAVRFHTASQPVLSRVLLCKKAQGVHRAIFEFSENVVASTPNVGAVARVDQPASGKTCTYANAGPVAASSMRWIDESCENFSESDPWRINLSAGLASPSGVPVGTFAGVRTVQQSVRIASLQDADNGCKVWRP
jgi:hypothetical protein